MIKVSRSGVAYSNYCKTLEENLLFWRELLLPPKKKQNLFIFDLRVPCGRHCEGLKRQMRKGDLVIVCWPNGRVWHRPNTWKLWETGSSFLMIFRYFPAILTLNSTPTSLILLSFPKKNNKAQVGTKIASVSPSISLQKPRVSKNQIVPR